MVFYPAFEIFLLPLDPYLNKKLGVWILIQMDIFGIWIHIKTYVDPKHWKIMAFLIPVNQCFGSTKAFMWITIQDP